MRGAQAQEGEVGLRQTAIFIFSKMFSRSTLFYHYSTTSYGVYGHIHSSRKHTIIPRDRVVAMWVRSARMTVKMNRLRSGIESSDGQWTDWILARYLDNISLGGKGRPVDSINSPTAIVRLALYTMHIQLHPIGSVADLIIIDHIIGDQSLHLCRI